MLSSQVEFDLQGWILAPSSPVKKVSTVMNLKNYSVLNGHNKFWNKNKSLCHNLAAPIFWHTT